MNDVFLYKEIHRFIKKIKHSLQNVKMNKTKNIPFDYMVITVIYKVQYNFFSLLTTKFMNTNFYAFITKALSFISITISIAIF